MEKWEDESTAIRVRVHANAQAADSARAVNALAYTVGSDMVFADNQYAANTSAGRRLLAHELTHIVQQSSENGHAQLRSELTINHPGDAFEQEANVAAGGVMKDCRLWAISSKKTIRR
jgi:maltoporin